MAARKIIKQIQSLIDEKDSRRNLGRVSTHKVQNFNIAPHELMDATDTDGDVGEDIDISKTRPLDLDYWVTSFVSDRGQYVDLTPTNSRVYSLTLQRNAIKSDKGDLWRNLGAAKTTTRFLTRFYVASDISHNIYLGSIPNASVAVWTQKSDQDTGLNEAPVRQYSSGIDKHTNGQIRLNFNGPGFFVVYIYVYFQKSAFVNFFRVGGQLGRIATTQSRDNPVSNIKPSFNLLAGGGTVGGVKSEFVDGRNSPTLRNILYFDRADNIDITAGDLDLDGYRIFNIINEDLSYTVVSGWSTTGFVVAGDKRMDYPLSQEFFTAGNQFLVSGADYIVENDQTVITVSGTGGWSGSVSDPIQIAKSLTLMNIANDSSIGAVISGLHDNVIEGETYKYEVALVDRSGNIGPRSERISIIAGDFSAPSKPSGVSATGGLRAIKLDWTNPTENDVKGLHIWDTANPVSGTDVPLATILKGTNTSLPTSAVVAQTQTETLSDNQSYTFYVSSFDWANNEDLTSLSGGTASTTLVLGNMTITGTLIATSMSDTDQDTTISTEQNGNDEDIIRFVTSGTERMQIHSSGVAGIGTVGIPAMPLEIRHATRKDIFQITTDVTDGPFMRWEGAAGAVAFVGGGNILVAGNGQSNFTIRSEDTIDFATNGANRRMRILSDGKVVIGGGTSATQLLEVAGSVVVANGQYLGMKTSGGSDGVALWASGADKLRFGNDAFWTGIEFFPGTAAKMFLTTAGRLGVGVSAPDAILHAKTSSSLVSKFETTGSNGPYLQLQGNGVTTGFIGGGSIMIAGNTQADLSIRCDTGGIHFATNSATRRMQIDSAGSVIVEENVQSANFSPDLTGWRISNAQNGFAEFEHIRARGSFKTTVFEKESIAVHGGEAWIANAAKIIGPVSASDTRIWFDNVTGFVTDEIVKIKKVDDITDGNFSTEYVKVTAVVVSGAGPNGHMDVERYWQGDLTAGNLITGFVNGTGFPYDTFTTSSNDIPAIFKTVAAGFQGAASNAIASVISGNKYYIECDVTTDSGIPPKITLVQTQSGASTGLSSAEKSLGEGHNEFVLEADINITTTPINAYVQLQNSGTAYDGIIDNWVVKLTKDRAKDVLGDDGEISGITYSEGQVAVTAGRVGTGYIRMNARSSDPTTPFIDIVERTGITNYYDLDMKVRLGDLSGLTSTQLLGQSPATAGFGLFSENVYLTGGISATYGDIGAWTINNNSISSTRISLDNANEQITIGTTNSIRISGSDTAPYISIAQSFPPVFSGTGLWMGIQDNVARLSFVNDQGSLLLSPEGMVFNNLTVSALNTGDEILNLNNGHIVVSGSSAGALAERPTIRFHDPSVNHGMTTLHPTDQWGSISALDGAAGGFALQGISDGGQAFKLFAHAFSSGVSTATSTGADGVIVLSSAKKSGTTVTTLSANENALIVQNSTTALAIFKGNGDLEVNGTVTSNSFDFAEYFESEEEIKGVVPIGLNLETGLVRKYRSGDELIGIHSLEPAFLANRGWNKDRSDHIAVGLVGQFRDIEDVIIEGRKVYTKDKAFRIGFVLKNGRTLLGMKEL